MKKHTYSILSIALLMIASATAQAAQLASAKVIQVEGTVTKYTADGQKSQLQTGEILKEGDSISATALSMAKLVFSNGSDLTIEENTSVNISKLQQDSFAGGKSYEQLQADPSKSQTLLELNYGKLKGHTKNLRSDSRFEIATPLGTAAIRGTNWEMLLIYNVERGEFLLSAKNVDGLMDIMSRYLGKFEYGKGNIGDKSYLSTLEESTREAVPADHTVVIRIRRGDPYFDDLFDRTKNYPPTSKTPVITPGPVPGTTGEDDFGIIVVSPEGPSNL